MHHGLARLLAKRAIERALVVAVDELVDKRLAAKLIHALHDLVRSREPESGEEGGVFLEEGGVGGVLEDDLVRVGEPDAEGLSSAKELKTKRIGQYSVLVLTDDMH